LNGVLDLASRPEAIHQALEAYRLHQSQQRDGKEEMARLNSELVKVKDEQKAAVLAQIQGIRAGMDPGSMRKYSPSWQTGGVRSKLAWNA
jgi:hypothetical protein